MKFLYKAVYAGRRMTWDGKKTYQLFYRTDNQKEMNFKKIRGVWLGYTYECAADKISTTPKRCDDERVDNPEWEAKDALVDSHNAKIRAERVLNKSKAPQLKNAIEAIKPLITKNLGYFETRALIEYLTDRAYKTKKVKL